ncbi:hypothetical protein Pla123a_08640 [Posidoniimonas polymericola]|uniref:DUF1559 domain-containing protein n=1 Tax=Posidoniimonas polymericola TaxID=2528002 RepID=A0A5C5YSZ6_9BACT|nr:DUF1559 domain-containing protein [Posidoniimonas polymericola]TWT78075.1 hypothetical protein Pla123a_08640 [Posidoniimonas polymericola]
MADENPYESTKSTPTVASGNPALVILGKLFLACVVLLIVAAMLMPLNRGGANRAARRMRCQNQMKQITLALLNYDAAHGKLPPAYTVDDEGRPLHSWRTLILPYVEQGDLYDSIDLTKPWDDPVNAHAREAVVDAYLCPSADHEASRTTYQVVAGAGYVFDGAKPMEFYDITDGPERTLLVVDVAADYAVEWMAPQDSTLEAVYQQFVEQEFNHPSGMQVGFADGHASMLDASSTREALRSMLTIAGGEQVEE